MMTAPVESTNPHAGVMTSLAATTAPGAKTEDAGLASQHILGHRPDERCHCCCQGCRQKRIRRDSIRRHGAAGIKAIPTHPQHPRTHHAQHHAVRRHRFAAEAKPFAQNQAQYQRRPARRHMHHSPAGEIDRANLCVLITRAIHHPVAAPNHVRQREINHEHPQRHKQQNGRIFHALSNRANDQRRRNNGEHQLVHGVNVVGDPFRITGIRRRSHALEKTPVQRAKNADGMLAAGVKREAVAAEPPENGDQSGNAEALRKHRQDILFTNQAAVKKCQSWQRHEQDQSSANHLESVMPRPGGRDLGSNVRERSGGPRLVFDICLKIRDAL